MTIYWNSLGDFLAMGGYGLYVWGSFATTALIMAGELWFLLVGRRRRLQVLQRQLRAESRSRAD